MLSVLQPLCFFFDSRLAISHCMEYGFTEIGVLQLNCEESSRSRRKSKVAWQQFPEKKNLVANKGGPVWSSGNSRARHARGLGIGSR